MVVIPTKGGGWLGICWHVGLQWFSGSSIGLCVKLLTFSDGKLLVDWPWPSGQSIRVWWWSGSAFLIYEDVNGFIAGVVRHRKRDCWEVRFLCKFRCCLMSFGIFGFLRSAFDVNVIY